MSPDSPQNDDNSEDAFVKQLERLQRAMDSESCDDATDAIADIFAMATKWCEENPSSELQLTLAAGECEANADWAMAEATYFKILALPDVQPHTEYKAYTSLASLCRLLHRDAEALEHARRATAAARRSDTPILLVMALQGEAWYRIRSSQIVEACKVVAEALAIVESDKLNEQQRAGLLMLRAECGLHNHTIEYAQRDLEQAFRLLSPFAGMSIAAGIQCDLANWWSITAKVRAALGEREGAVTAWRNAVFISKQVAELPHAADVHSMVMVANRLRRLADALVACDQIDEAAQLMAQRRGILCAVGLPVSE